MLLTISGQWIPELCSDNQITLKELAEKIGISASKLCWIVRGEV